MSSPNLFLLWIPACVGWASQTLATKIFANKALSNCPLSKHNQTDRSVQSKILLASGCWRKNKELSLEFKKSLSIPKAARHLKINKVFWTFKKQTKPLLFSSRFLGAASLGFFPREPFHLRTMIPILQSFTLLRSTLSAILAKLAPSLRMD